MRTTSIKTALLDYSNRALFCINCNAVATLGKSLPGYIRSLTMQLERDLQAEEKGVFGEDVVDVYLKKNCMGRVMSSVILPGVRDSEDAPKTAESDLVVICTNGVYDFSAEEGTFSAKVSLNLK